MPWLTTFIDVALPFVVVFWLVFLLLPVYLKLRHIQTQIDGLVIPVCHLPREKDHADL